MICFLNITERKVFFPERWRDSHTISKRFFLACQSENNWIFICLNPAKISDLSRIVNHRLEASWGRRREIKRGRGGEIERERGRERGRYNAKEIKKRGRKRYEKGRERERRRERKREPRRNREKGREKIDKEGEKIAGESRRVGKREEES